MRQVETLPCSPDVERFLLGSVLLNDSLYFDVAAAVKDDDFSLEAHRRIWKSITRVFESGEKVDRVTVINDLQRENLLQAVGGFAYMVDLDNGIPQTKNVDGYVRILREKSALRRIIFASQKMIDRCMVEEDSAEILSSGNESLLMIANAAADEDPKTMLEIMEAHGGVSEYLQRTEPERGLLTGFQDFDDLTGGLLGGQLFVLAARPSMGKTAFALNVACHVAAHQAKEQTVAVFSLETKNKALLDRVLCGYARVPKEKFKYGRCSAEERDRMMDAVNRMHKRILFDDHFGQTPMQIRAKARRIKQKYPLALVVVDYLQLFDGAGEENRTQEIRKISRSFKLLSGELDVPVIVLSQLSRACEARTNKRPMMSDLRESGSIEQDADIVAFIFREEVYEPHREDLRGLAELIVPKQRDGDTRTIDLLWNKNITRFDNRARGTE